jgi:hypothetical protein
MKTTVIPLKTTTIAESGLARVLSIAKNAVASEAPKPMTCQRRPRRVCSAISCD